MADPGEGAAIEGSAAMDDRTGSRNDGARRPGRGLRAHVVLRLAAGAVALAGLAAAAAIDRTASATDGSTASLDRARVIDLQLERLGGRFAVTAGHLRDRFDALWSGRPLALTILVLAGVVAVALWWIAGYAAVDPGERDDDAH
ncbi:hypothetical protein EYW49_22180 [Siculibacillus lacustris]|uniref:Uncharacterized protein n=1 Tax=Siculibacillus lacustris TaxID=1549641 RepID=A0A4Q9VCR8_9HYPH|nr:hypothetical protein [Siculibacillus lacustris]TBW32372.1 hypothetical protein EYW49_22180 [Siculibacillus lacustris]